MIYLRRCLRLPALKYVDDFFGVSRGGVQFDLGHCLEVVACALGTPTDPKKTERFRQQMIILGMEVTLMWLKRAVSLCLPEEKKAQWQETIETALRSGILSMADATKLAGRLTWACTALVSRVGRAQLKPVYAQANRPLPSGRVSPWLARSLAWWLNFMDWMPRIVRQVGGDEERRHVVTWADASGAEAKVAAVMWSAEEQCWYHTWCVVPRSLLNLFLVRGDNDIMAEELLAVVLAMTTFDEYIDGQFWTIFCDNQAVLNIFLNGAAAAAAGDLNGVTGKLWMEIVVRRISVNMVRVESKANVADGPTRDRFQLLEAYGSKFVQPRFPAWIQDFWQPWSLEDGERLPS